LAGTSAALIATLQRNEAQNQNLTSISMILRPQFIDLAVSNSSSSTLAAQLRHADSISDDM
jgi:hypothetical protein